MTRPQHPMHIYDDFARYDDILTGFYAHNPEIANLLRSLLNGYSGDCLDVGCGTGILDPMVEEMGLKVTGIDISNHQLQVATSMGRLTRTIQADVNDLPFDTAAFDVAMSCYTHTDFDDWQNALKEITRVVKPGGVFVYVGAHPCFFGAHAKRSTFKKVEAYSKYYWNEDRIFKAPGFSKGGVREKVGERHLSLMAFLNAFSEAGLHIERVLEDQSAALPMSIGIRAVRKP